MIMILKYKIAGFSQISILLTTNKTNPTVLGQVGLSNYTEKEKYHG